MLELIIEPEEMWDSVNRRFVYEGERVVVQLEHSLASMSKWEAEFKKPFLDNKNKTDSDTERYLELMIINDVDPSVLSRMTQEHYDKIRDYINDPQTATIIKKTPKGNKTGEFITAELIYYWMIQHNIPESREHWHLNRLLTLIDICSLKSQPPKKRSGKDIAEEQRALNAARLAKHGTKG